ncbi:protein of unknown function (plasmid) [Agrobacterium pusense]|uniref:Uncharacterized protein n=1 Tax=Agrobacterium pusense TaxID=648995 RepID=U4Q8V3_9HYPH|nr:protein of unknown function [Agrobacterium pusense]
MRSSIQTYVFTIACIASAAQYRRARFQGVTDYCTIWPRWRFLTRARETGAATADTSRPRTPLATLLLIKNGSIKNDSFRTALGPDAGVPGMNGRVSGAFSFLKFVHWTQPGPRRIVF